uniref:Uncharacterized protein n=1 Tax=Steinernema glaseri TaxID=37863 RepID=A0A1I7YIC2_9BILA
MRSRKVPTWLSHSAPTDLITMVKSSLRRSRGTSCVRKSENRKNLVSLKWFDFASRMRTIVSKSVEIGEAEESGVIEVVRLRIPHEDDCLHVGSATYYMIGIDADPFFSIEFKGMEEERAGGRAESPPRGRVSFLELNGPSGAPGEGGHRVVGHVYKQEI